jgi:hypothetical protein
MTSAWAELEELIRAEMRKVYSENIKGEREYASYNFNCR